MAGAAHLDRPHAQLDIRLAFLEVPEQEDSVREELFSEGGQLAAVPGGDLGDQEARRPEGLQESEEVEQVAPRLLEVAQAVQGREAVNCHEVEAVDLDALLDVLAEDLEPVLRQLLLLVLQ